MIPKFRAWHKPIQRMSEVLAISYERQKVKIRHLRWTTHRTVPFYYVELMQSTGLFDKNGAEIFENDVVEWKLKDTGQLVRGIVKYDTELGFWGVREIRFKHLKLISYLDSERVTVLGNIYQNKELVEELK